MKVEEKNSMASVAGDASTRSARTEEPNSVGGMAEEIGSRAFYMLEAAQWQGIAKRALGSLRALQDGAALALAIAPESGPVADFLAAIHREAVRGQLASDEVSNEVTPPAETGADGGAERVHSSLPPAEPPSPSPALTREEGDPRPDVLREVVEALKAVRLAYTLAHVSQGIDPAGSASLRQADAALTRAQEVMGDD